MIHEWNLLLSVAVLNWACKMRRLILNGRILLKFTCAICPQKLTHANFRRFGKPEGCPGRHPIKTFFFKLSWQMRQYLASRTSNPEQDADDEASKIEEKVSMSVIWMSVIWMSVIWMSVLHAKNGHFSETSFYTKPVSQRTLAIETVAPEWKQSKRS